MKKVFSGQQIITAIDVGTTKICVLIAKQVGDELEILGIGKTPSLGLKKGVVVDINQTVQSIQKAISEAQLMAEYQIQEAYIGISGSHIQSFNSAGAVPIRKGQVQQSDVQEVLAAAKAVPLKEGQQVLHVLPQYFIVDGKDKVTNPIGLHGVRLEAVVHVITGSVASIQDLITCCEKTGVKVKDIILEQLASAAAVLSSDEKTLGVGVLDIGGGTSDFAVYQNDAIRYTKVLPIAGNMFTSDLAVGVRSTLHDAERIKKECGYVGGHTFDIDDAVDIEMVQGNITCSIEKNKISHILRSRAEELLLMLDHDMKKNNIKPYMISGLVITGGGSLLRGIDELARKILSVPVRIGKPRVTTLLPESLQNPIYATGYGLLVYVMQNRAHNSMETMQGPMVKKIMLKMKSWISDFF
ncbi:cell division protein FtsA [bacterium]|jgi:cell division protein FtsA|nr:cell division protein FtsA [bacterium]NBX78483.1 cell division protein FtsA [bacterium]